MTVLLAEDDCAPDAKKYFIEQMKEKFNLNFQDFIKKGRTIYPDERSVEYHLNGYVLSYCSEDPFYKLERR